MAEYSLARRAESDLKSIGDFTRKTWGIAQARRYVDNLEKCFQLLAGNPWLGRPFDPSVPILRRHEHGKHVIFYFPQLDGILIVRILHQQMIASKNRLHPRSRS